METQMVQEVYMFRSNWMESRLQLTGKNIEEQKIYILKEMQRKVAYDGWENFQKKSKA